MNTAQRWTTFTARCLAGLFGSFMIHASLSKGITGVLITLATLIVGVGLVLKCEYSPKDDSQEELAKQEKMNWIQFQVIFVTLAALFGGAFVWWI